MDDAFKYSDWCQHLEAVKRGLHGHPGLVRRALCETPIECFQQNVDENGGEEIAESWLSLCLDYCRYLLSVGETEEALQFLQLAYARLQLLATPGAQSVAVVHWAMHKLDGVIVMIIESCQQLPEQQCVTETSLAIEQHIAFMNANHHLNLNSRQFVRGT
ncbi:hypothetical protein NF212_24865 [Parasalinivibrio latis]|uniref:hypothetical protein n=1 Tax=Parasalinivibrio latis TaxID=2952610 RepID=UPI0030E2C8F4